MRKFEYAVVEVIGRSLTGGAFVRNCETDVAFLEEARDEDVAPFLL